MGDSVNGFKTTEIGEIPEEWDVSQLAKVVTFSKKPRNLQLSDYDTVPFFPMELLPDSDVFTGSYIPKSPNEIRSGTYVEKGDILVAKITPSFENGKQAIVKDIPTPFAYATTEVYRFHPSDEAQLERMFLFYYLKMPNVRLGIANKMEGTTGRQRVPKTVLENLLIPLPQPIEQHNIAQVLSRIQNAIQAQEKIVTSAIELKRSLMHRLFTYGPYEEEWPVKETDFGDVPEHWRVLTLSQCAYIQTGVAKGRRLEKESTIEVPYLRVANVQDGRLDLQEIKKIRIKKSELERYRLQDRDVVLTEGGDFDKLGRGFIWRGEINTCIHQNHIFAIRTDHNLLLPEFLAYLVQSNYGKRYFLKVAHRTTNLASINSTKLKALPCLVPSLDEQQQIAEQLEAVDKKIAVEEDRKSALESLFKSMLQQLMTGQIRVHNLELTGADEPKKPKDVVVLEWTFSPADYFEDEIHLERDDYEMFISRGKVEAKIELRVYNQNPNIRGEIHTALNNRFLGVQLLSHKPYKLSKASMHRIHPDGRLDITLFAEGGAYAVATVRADFVVRDKDGNIISDSRKDRIEKKKALAELAEKYRSDRTTASLLDSYKAAVNDPDNELVHLYEIRDALSKEFGSDRAARQTLNISSTRWSRFGTITNNEPLKQGRHRGKHFGMLRDATKEELTEARNIARRFIESYLGYLESKNSDLVQQLNP